MAADLTLIVVEDNELLREEMVSFLTRPGWQAHGVDCGEELNFWLMQNSPHIAILDVNLPYEDGYSIAARLRTSHPRVGIIMLTARVRHGERATGYQSGADVYLTKPSSPLELMAVIDSLSSRLAFAEPKQPEPSYLLHRQQCALHTPEGKRCRLTRSETRLLEIMALLPEREADIDYLAHALSRRDGTPVSKESLVVLISRLRQKAKDALALNNLLVVNRGLGYRLTVPLEVQA